MRRTSLAVAGAFGVAAMLTMTACSGAGSSSEGGGDKTLTVWLMQDTLTKVSQEAVIKKFEAETGATVKISIQQWDNINTKLTTALATENPPDVVEIGNTNVPLFAANGALADITAEKKSLSGGREWLTGLEGPATVGGKLYAVPFYAGTRAVIYNKQLWSAAGITQPPSSYDEFIANLDTLRAKNPASDFSPIYLPGSYWYNAMSFLYDAGGSLAKESKGDWKGQLSTPAAKAGLANFKTFQNAYSTEASRSAPMDTPQPSDVFATGKTATVMGNGNAVKTIEQSNPALKGQVGTFPFPSQADPGKNMPNFLGGSDLGIAAKSPNQALALKFLKFVSSPSIQIDQISTASGHIPASQKLIDEATKSQPEELRAFYAAAKLSIATPATPGWATIESDNSVVDFFSQIASGTKTVDKAASDFDKHLESALNANK